MDRKPPEERCVEESWTPQRTPFRGNESNDRREALAGFTYKTLDRVLHIKIDTKTLNHSCIRYRPNTAAPGE